MNAKRVDVPTGGGNGIESGHSPGTAAPESLVPQGRQQRAVDTPSLASGLLSLSHKGFRVRYPGLESFQQLLFLQIVSEPLEAQLNWAIKPA
jgi:hypothetical protein